MVSHKLRLIIIAIGCLVALLATVILIALGKDEGTGFGAVLGVLGTLVPALLDAQTEQKKLVRASTAPEEG